MSDEDPSLAVVLGSWVGDRLAEDARARGDAAPEGVHVVGFTHPEGVGHSNETLLFTVAWHEGSVERTLPLVARLETTGAGVFPTYDLSVQIRCVEQVARSSDVPVPTVRWVAADRSLLGRSFYVMDRIDAVVPADRMPYTIDGWLHDASEEQQRALWSGSIDVLAAIHRIDWEAGGFAFLDHSEHGPTGLGQLLAWWLAYADWVCDGRPQPTIDAAGQWLVANVPTATSPTGLVWGDARISNMMYDDFAPVAVLDWEMAALGPPEVDVAWFLFFRRFFSEGLGVEDLPGFPDDAESIARYEAAAGRPLAELTWYTVFAAWRHSTIMLRLADMYEATGEFPPGNGAGQNNIATRMLAEMLDLPSPGEPGGFMG